MASSGVSLSDFLRSVYIPSRLEYAPGSVLQMQVSIRVLERWAGRTLTLGDLSEDLLRRFLADYYRSRSYGTVNSKRCHLLALWRCAWEEDYLPSPPKSRKVRKAKVRPVIPEAWTAKEVGRILVAAREATGSIDGIPAADWFESIFLVAYDTGERRGAIMATTPADLSLAGGWIQFRRTKTGLPRLCPLAPDTVAACRRIYDPQQRLVWPWPFSREYFDHRLKTILRRAGVAFGRGRGGLMHKFRRTAGTLVEAAGGRGDVFLGNTRAVFLASYRDPRFFSSDLCRLPRPR